MRRPVPELRSRVQDQSVDSPFRRSVVIWLVAVATASLTLALALLVVQPEGAEPKSSAADSFSRSALGHRAFVELLRASGVPVLVSRYASAERAGHAALLLVAEPRLEARDSGRARRLAAMSGEGRTTLLVLPKWEGRESARRRGWIETAELLADDQVELALSAVEAPARAVRPGDAGRCDHGFSDAGWLRPQLLLATSPALRPLLGCEGGVLLAEITTQSGGRLFVLSDPDLVSNHGLARGDNASRALDVLGRVRRAGQSVVVDETLHGFERAPSLWRELFAFPLLPAAVQGLLALLALVWSGLGRFGAPLPTATAPATGRALLIENTAALLGSAGHSADSLGRYFDATLSDLAQTLHAPASAASRAPLAWLAEAARRRGARRDVTAIRARVERLRRAARPSPAAILAAARDIHGWKKEMLRGPEDHPGHQGTPAR